ncbi:integrase arm-type DNA-binding domain-containing protein [Pseudomonas gingeri]|uniref:tyrosine-type recombinase/integrase n=1 Tax=Pseudomonas gingeri TaxID=117681 RepID=UPI0015A0DFBB|nr:site-specific integrase [Pseudomonas gingeri]NWA26430.1 integrase arm-type DNA-binding domain-containing protein [Pseudomonas gingeri]NWD67945.1 integrase arm-type DNA-binding domain-containing protein [Pseudomonas gingeri]
MGKLNTKQIENLSEPGTYEDGDGLRLVVKASGKKSWVLRFQLAGKRREMGLGGFPDVKLKDARSEAVIQRQLLQKKIDPLAEREATRLAVAKAVLTEQAKAITFKSVALDYIAAHRSGWKNAKHAQQWENTLTTYAYPVLENLSAKEVTTEHVLKVLTPIWQVKPETASRVRNRMEMVLDAAKVRGLREGENPARWRGHLDKLLPPRSKVKTVVHHPALPWVEMPAFMKEISKHDELSYKAMQMTILTACRTNEVLGATWDEFDLEKGVWKIPPHRMKAAKEHRVPLSQAALDLLNGLIRMRGNSHVFPGAREGKHLSNMSMLMGLRRMGRTDLTMHGFRSTFRDWAAESTQYTREVCELALAHVRQDKVEAAYFRGDLFEKRQAMMSDWAAFVTQPSGV